MQLFLHIYPFADYGCQPYNLKIVSLPLTYTVYLPYHGQMNLRTKLLNMAYNYCSAAGIELSTLSTLMRNDGKFLDGIKSGKSCTIDTYEDCIAWLKLNKPKPKKHR